MYNNTNITRKRITAPIRNELQYLNKPTGPTLFDYLQLSILPISKKKKKKRTELTKFTFITTIIGFILKFYSVVLKVMITVLGTIIFKPISSNNNYILKQRKKNLKKNIDKIIDYLTNITEKLGKIIEEPSETNIDNLNTQLNTYSENIKKYLIKLEFNIKKLKTISNSNIKTSPTLEYLFTIVLSGISVIINSLNDFLSDKTNIKKFNTKINNLQLTILDNIDDFDNYLTTLEQNGTLTNLSERLAEPISELTEISLETYIGIIINLINAIPPFNDIISILKSSKIAEDFIKNTNSSISKIHSSLSSINDYLANKYNQSNQLLINDASNNVNIGGSIKYNKFNIKKKYYKYNKTKKIKNKK